MILYIRPCKKCGKLFDMGSGNLCSKCKKGRKDGRETKELCY